MGDFMLEKDKLKKLLTDLESDRVERKSSLSQKDKIKRTICAFANDLPGNNLPGIIFIGAKDDGTCANIKITDDMIREIANIRSDGNILPPPVITVKKEVIEKCELAVITVEPSIQPPVRYNGKIFVRVGSTTQVAKHQEEIRLIERQRNYNLPFDYREVRDSTKEDLNIELIDKGYIPFAISSEILTKNNYLPEVENIFVSKSDSKRIMKLDPDKTGLLASWLFQRLVSRINIKSLGDEKSHTSIAIAYNTNGMSVAWGQNINVCQNMNIFGDTIMYTYGSGSSKVQEYEKIKQIFNEWCLSAEEKRAFDLEVYRKMQEITINKGSGIRQFIGDMHLDAVKTAYIDPRINAPLNIGQLSEYSKQFLNDYGNSTTGVDDENNFVTLHDLYQVGTSILKPNKTDIVSIWDDVRNWGNNLITKFNLN